MAKTVASESLDFAAHAGSAFLILVAAKWLGCLWTWQAALLTAWACGFIREFTEWQDGGRPPFTRWGILDQIGWISGGLVFCFAARLW